MKITRLPEDQCSATRTAQATSLNWEVGIRNSRPNDVYILLDNVQRGAGAGLTVVDVVRE